MLTGQYYFRDNVESNRVQETEYFTSTYDECGDGIGSHTTPTDGYDLSIPWRFLVLLLVVLLF